LLRGAPKRNAEGTPLRVLSKHGSDLVLARDEEAARFRLCHPRPFPQVADLRECRFLRAVFHPPAIATKAS